MKKLGFIAIVAAGLLTFQSCNNEAKDAKETADSLNEVKDTTSNVSATGGIAVGEKDAMFATEAANGGMVEVEFGKVALSKTNNAQLKAFAEMMVSDHGKANEELKTIAMAKNITLPVSIDEDHQKKMNELKGMSGKDFDKKYTDLMVDGHEKTLKMMEDEAKDGMDAELKAFAGKTAPTVKAHLDMIKKIKDSMK